MTSGMGAVGYIRVYTDADNVTRFEDLEYDAVPVDFAPPAPPVFVTAAQSASSVTFLRFPKGWADAAHSGPGHGLTALTDVVFAVVRL